MNNPTPAVPVAPVEETPENAAPVAAPEPVAPAPQSDNRRRLLRDLLSIPERDRTDEQWDEIIELEIQLAPGNRIAGNERGHTPGPQMSGQNRPGGQQKKQQQRQARPGGGGGGGNGGGNNKRRPRGNKPSGGSGPAA